MKSSYLDTYQPPPQQQKQIAYLFDLLEKSRANNIVVWVLGGYGLDHEFRTSCHPGTK